MRFRSLSTPHPQLSIHHAADLKSCDPTIEVDCTELFSSLDCSIAVAIQRKTRTSSGLVVFTLFPLET